MPKSEIDLSELAFAFENHGWEVNHYFDCETGAVLAISPQIERDLDELYDPKSDYPANLLKAIEECDVADWEKAQLIEALNVAEGYNTRYLMVPQIPSYEGYADMEAFIDTVRNRRLQQRLERSIRGRGAFRRFKNVLLSYPSQEQAWFKFKEAQMEERVIAWLESKGVDLTSKALPVSPSSSEPTIRAQLISEVLLFVRNASKLPDITRIALIGSLTTDKPEPKDADVLVTVTENADLAPLAKLGRQLSGHAQSFGRGGDVFLANPNNDYLGRTCPWTRCEPGIRISCDALHCGSRAYLHDDLKTIRLKKELVTTPPLILWPQIHARLPVPEDVQQGLLAPLRKGD